jgi:hypothetical protein
LLDLPVQYFAASFDREKLAEFQALLKYDVKSTKYDVWAPILFPGRRKDFKQVFRVEFLARVRLDTVY